MRTYFISISILFLCGDSFAASIKDIETKIDLSLVYSDSAPSIRKKGKTPSFTQEQEPSPENRSLGLGKVKVDVSASVPNSSGVFLQLRPDAELRAREDGKDLDTRAGSVYRSAPPIELLNSYYISHNRGEDSRYLVGVFENIDIDMNSYRPMNQFGLEAILPQSFAAIKTSFTLSKDRSQKESSKGLYLDLMLLQGREDRGESLSYNDSSFDEGPGGQDPYVGAASSVLFADDEGVGKVALLGGTLESKIELGRVSEIFGQFAYSKQANFFVPSNFSLELKTSIERWRNTSTRYRDLTQSSLFASSTLEFLPENWFALGLHRGKSQRHNDNDASKINEFSGWALDIGYIVALSKNSKVTASYTTEKRTKLAEGKTTGGFESAMINRSEIHRVGLELRYLL